MKLISFAIPSYNSQDYMAHAIETILSGGEEVEIIIVNDGSKDNTAVIADEYAAKYPTIVKAIHKENGGHGSGVNRGVEEASGLYYKVVDSDDWVNEKALKQLLDTVRTHVERGVEADLYITNFIYDHQEDHTKFRRHYRRQFPKNEFFTWESAKRFFGSNVLLMHSLLYKTEVIRQSGLKLPEHTFYVDNIFAYQPLGYCEKLFYLDVDLYHYFIGRSDQSVNINNLLKRYEQQVRVMYCMLEAYRYEEIDSMVSGLRNYLLHDLNAIMMNTLMFTCGETSEERKDVYKKLWGDLKERDPQMYRYLRHRGLPALVCWMPWELRRRVLLFGYKVLCKVVKLG